MRSLHNIIILVLLQIILIKPQNVPYSGVRFALTMQSYKQDLAHIYRTILRNSKFFDYPDKEFLLSFNKESFKLRISEIEQVNFSCDENFIAKEFSHYINPVGVIFNYSGSLAQATYKFQWELKHGNFHVSEGGGITNYSTLNASIFVSTGISLHAISQTYWNLTEFKISGATVIGIDENIANEVSNIIYSGLKDAEITNTNFIDKYSAIKYHRIKSLIESDFTTIILSNSLDHVDALSIKGIDMMVFSFNSSVSLNFTSEPFFMKSFVTSTPNLTNGIEVCFNNEISVAAFNSLINFQSFLFDIDPKSVGFSGYTSDLFIIAPQLSDTLPPDRHYSIKCKNTNNKSIEYNNSDSSFMKIPISCNILLDISNSVIFRFDFLSYTEFSHKANDDLYYAYITNSRIYQIISVSIDVKAAEFLLFANKMLNILNGKVFDLPNLYGDFMLKREYSEFMANTIDSCLYYI